MNHPLVDWLYGEALPLWLAKGIDHRQGGFHESLDPVDFVCRADFRRLYIAARQIYVFAEAERAGIRQASAAVELGLDFLERYARLPSGGYSWRFDEQNRTTDATCDLYDLAFVLFAFSKAGRPEQCHGPARDLIAFIDRALKDAGAGWREADPPRLPRRQNPHMHLLEAVLSAHETFGDQHFLDCADEIVTLLLERFIQPDGGLTEYYSAVLVGYVSEKDGVTEPGHHFEWAWLLRWYLRIRRPKHERALAIENAAEVLVGFAERHGISQSFNAALDEINGDGSIRVGSAKLWPQTERLKAVLAWPGYSIHGLNSALAGLGAYIETMPRGCWQEQRDAQGEFIRQPMQAGSLYHLTCALIELDKSQR